MTHRYEWNKLDKGWSYTPADGAVYESISCRNSRGYRVYFSVADLRSGTPSCGTHHPMWPEALAQLAKCRIRDTEPVPVDNTPLFEAMDRMSAEIPAVEWAKVPQYDHGSMIAAYGAPPPPKEPLVGGALAPNAREYVAIPGIPLEWMEPQPFQPWRRGPLAAWTLVNISAHDGRLTVVMKRGRVNSSTRPGPMMSRYGSGWRRRWWTTRRRRLKRKQRQRKRRSAPTSDTTPHYVLARGTAMQYAALGPCEGRW